MSFYLLNLVFSHYACSQVANPKKLFFFSVKEGFRVFALKLGHFIIYESLKYLKFLQKNIHQQRALLIFSLFKFSQHVSTQTGSSSGELN